jgi:integrase
MARVGRKRTVHKHLPPRMHLKRGRYYYGRNDEFIGDNLADAFLVYGEREAARVGRRPKTFKDLADQYAAKVIPGKAPRTQEDYLDDLAMLLTAFATAPLDRVIPEHIRGYLDNRMSKKPRANGEEPKPAKTRANREIALFSAIWNWGRDSGRVLFANPCDGVSRFTEKGRDRYVTDEEFSAVHDAADEPLRDALELYLLTGQRVADVLRMSLTDVREGCLWVKQRKTGKKLRLSLVGELEGTVARIRDRKFPDDAVVTLAMIRDERGQPLTYDALFNRFEEARTKAGVHFQLRDLRAKAATDLEDLALAQKLLGHTTRAMTEKYTKQRIGERVSPLLRTSRGIADKKSGAE